MKTREETQAIRKLVKTDAYQRKLMLISPTNSGKPKLYDMRNNLTEQRNKSALKWKYFE